MKALDYLYSMKKAYDETLGIVPITIYEAIKELEAYIADYQGIKRRLNNAVITLSVLGHQNKSLVTILEKYNKETIELKKENKDLKERLR